MGRRVADHELQGRLLRREFFFGLLVGVPCDERAAFLPYALDNRLDPRVVVLHAVGQLRESSRDHQRIHTVVFFFILLELLAEL